MKKKIIGGIFVLAIVAIVMLNVNLGLNSLNPKLSSLSLANIEALANESGESGESGGVHPEWWDYLNNYEVSERIPINSRTCSGGFIRYYDISLFIGECNTYSYIIYHRCYDGGNRDECTSDHIHEMI